MLLFEETRPGNPFVPPALMRCELGALFFLECPFSSSSSADWRRIVALIFLSSSPSPFLDVAASPFGVFRDDRAESDWNHVDVIYYYYAIIYLFKSTERVVVRRPSSSSSKISSSKRRGIFPKNTKEFLKEERRTVSTTSLLFRVFYRRSWL
jgi:hypothetical protein